MDSSDSMDRPPGPQEDEAGGKIAVPKSLPMMFLVRNGYLPDLARPTTFNELMQVRKLTDRNPLYPVLADKIRVKDYVAERLGPEWVIPTLWFGDTLPETIEWPTPFVLKSSHGSQQCLFVRSPDVDWAQMRRKAMAWLKKPYGQLLHEWLYSQVERRLLIEPYVGDVTCLPVDYKFFVFGGRAEYIQVDTDREHAHKRTMFDRNWERLPLRLRYPIDPRPIEKPPSLPLLMEAAEELSRGFDFVRVDFYEVAGQRLFGEMTFYANSGLDRFTPASFDKQFGAHWLAASRARAKSSS
jgi:hypothetical protein